jgi:murein DD-endopeptidase MepM/ murein hydrolase activator NlpD
MDIAVLISVLVVAFVIITTRKPKKEVFGASLPPVRSPLSVPLVLRNDIQGLGHFGARRKNRKHNGIDFLAQPNTAVFAPISGTIRPVTVYSGDPRWKGVSIKNPTMEVKVFYMEPLKNLTTVTQGMRIGAVQNMAVPHPGMKNHIHIEVYINGKLVDPSPYFKYSK